MCIDVYGAVYKQLFVTVSTPVCTLFLIGTYVCVGVTVCDCVTISVYIWLYLALWLHVSAYDLVTGRYYVWLSVTVHRCDCVWLCVRVRRCMRECDSMWPCACTCSRASVWCVYEKWYEWVCIWQGSRKVSNKQDESRKWDMWPCLRYLLGSLLAGAFWQLFIYIYNFFFY